MSSKLAIIKRVRYFPLIAAAIFLAAMFSIPANAATEQVHGHLKKNGKYVYSHSRSKANKTQRDNWSSQGNANPRTGKRGKKRIKK